MFGAQGGRLGPNLSRIGDEKNLAELKRAILDPDEGLRDGYRTGEVRTGDGSVIRGVIKNEDTFSLQMMDDHERLHMFRKADLREVTRPQHSLMPAPHLSAAELDNLIAFLKTTEPSEIRPGPWTPSPDLNVSFQRIRNAREEPQNWLTYWGDYQGTHYSHLKSITPENVASLSSQWSFQFSGTGVETTPIVVDGIMFVTSALDNVAGLDARTGSPIWRYQRRLPDVRAQCLVMTNRGFSHPRRPIVYGNARRSSARARRQNRKRHLGYRSCRLSPGLFHDASRRSRSTARSSSASPRANAHSQGSSTPTTPPRVRDSGERIPCRGRAIQREPPGRRNLRRMLAAAPPG